MCTHIEDVVYYSFHWMLHVIDLRENCVYVLDSLRSKVNEDIHGIINVGLKTWQAKHDLQRYRSTPNGDCKFNTKNAYRQEEIDEIRMNGPFVSDLFLYGSVEKFLYGSVEKCACILVLDLMHCRCLLLVCHGW
ncbi:hypothetical protein IC575_009299 [Cucumis melo]